MFPPTDCSVPPLPALPPVPQAPTERPDAKHHYSSEDICFFLSPLAVLFAIGLCGTAAMKNNSAIFILLPLVNGFIVFRKRLWLLFTDIAAYPESLNLTEHLQVLMPGSKVEVHIDWSDRALKEAYAVRKGSLLLISRLLQTRLTPPKLDYILVRTALNDKLLMMRYSLISGACISALCWLPFLIGMTLFLILSGVAVGLALKHKRENNVTQQALELTQDLEAALDCLPALCYIDCGQFDFRVAQIYETQMLAKGQVLGLPVPPWDSPYALY
ncbi:MAG TPA: hypothetical protein VGL56_03700 [Fimbriimonadaceae bacterium]|jgi:hypothetical protein